MELLKGKCIAKDVDVVNWMKWSHAVDKMSLVMISRCLRKLFSKVLIEVALYIEFFYIQNIDDWVISDKSQCYSAISLVMLRRQKISLRSFGLFKRE